MRTMRFTVVVVVGLGACKGESKKSEPAPKPNTTETGSAAAAPAPAAQPAAPTTPSKPPTVSCCGADEASATVQRGTCTNPLGWTNCGSVNASDAPLLETSVQAQWDGEPFPPVIVWAHPDGPPTLLRVRATDETAHLEYMRANRWEELGVAEINMARGGNAALVRKADGTVVFTSAMSAASQDEGSASAFLIAANAKDGTVKVSKKWSGSDLDKLPAWTK